MSGTATTALRIVSYNLLHGMHLARRGTVDLPAVAEVLAEVGADVVALQEVDRDQARSGHVDQAADLGDRLGMRGVFCAALSGSPDHSWTPATDTTTGPAYGVGLLTRLPLRAVRRVALPGGGAGTRSPDASLRNPGWDHEPRVALAAAVDVGGRTVEFIVTHLSYLPWRAVRQLRTATAAATAPTAVLVGDLNLPAALVRALPAWRHAGGAATYPAWKPRVQVHHVLVRGGARVDGVTVHPRSTSDHRPLIADLRVPAAAG